VRGRDGYITHFDARTPGQAPALAQNINSWAEIGGRDQDGSGISHGSWVARRRNNGRGVSNAISVKAIDSSSRWRETFAKQFYARRVFDASWLLKLPHVAQPCASEKHIALRALALEPRLELILTFHLLQARSSPLSFLDFFGFVGNARLGCSRFPKAPAGTALIGRTNTGCLGWNNPPSLPTLWFAVDERGFLVPLRIIAEPDALRSGKHRYGARSNAPAGLLRTPDMTPTASARESDP
jgi:hypothetical protein